MNNTDYFKLTSDTQNIKDIFTSGGAFCELYNNANSLEKKSLLQYFVFNNKPFAFSDKPILYENIIQYISNSLNIDSNNVKLIGSGKTGFSISLDKYGLVYSKVGRDLDFSIIDHNLFLNLKSEFDVWRTDYQSGSSKPKNDNEKRYWDENIRSLPNTLKRGFIDSYKMPNLHQLPITRKVNNCMFLIVRNLSSYYDIQAKNASVRIYRTWEGFERQIKLNTEYVLNQL